VTVTMHLFVTCFKDLKTGSFGLEHYIGHMMVTDDNRIALIATNK